MQQQAQEQININQEESEEQQGADIQVQSSSSQPSPKRPKLRSGPNICSNKICSFFKNTKYNQNNENNVENLCSQCIKQYEKQLYCLYCKQVYFETTDDGKQWIMCDECERWVHTQCADFPSNVQTNTFNCLRCRKIEVPLSNVASSVVTNNVSQRRLTRPGTNGARVPQRRKTQQCMLNNFGFYWQLSPAELAEDVQKLKQFIR